MKNLIFIIFILFISCIQQEERCFRHCFSKLDAWIESENIIIGMKNCSDICSRIYNPSNYKEK
jgi:hypothetical protein